MNRTLYDIHIKAVKISRTTDLIRVTTDNNSRSAMYHNILQKEWDFLEDILDAFSADKDLVNNVLRIAKEYKGYNGKVNLQDKD